MRRTTPRGWLVLSAALAVLAVLAVPSLASARAWLGVYTQEVTRELRDALDLSGDGALVSSVVPDGPADRAGLRKGDVIVSVDRHDVASPSDLTERIGEARAGDEVTLAVVRKGERLQIDVRLAERPQDDDELSAPAPPAVPTPRVAPVPRTPAVPKAPGDELDRDELRQRIRESIPDLDIERDFGPGLHRSLMGLAGRGRLGVRIESLNDDLASALGSPRARGALVVEVLKQTPAEAAGIRAGDIITAVGGTAVDDADGLVQALRNEEGKVSISLLRRGEKRTVEAALEDAPRVYRLRDRSGPLGMGRMGDDGKVDVRVKRGADDEDLRRQLDELREQLRQLRRELEESRR